MNLEPKHFPAILFGGLIGAFLGFIISLFIKQNLFPEIEKVIGTKGLYILFGAIAGVAFSIIKLVIKSAQSNDNEFAHNFTQINGMGSFLFGKSDIKEDESYMTTEWFTILWLPVFPVCRYRLIAHKRRPFSSNATYTLLEKHPPKAKHIIKVYMIDIAIISSITACAYFLFS